MTIKHGVSKKKNDYLEHHGIKGMKWGVRRYQNADGTLTAAGKKRYDEPNSKYSKEDRELDKFVWGKSGVKRINRRMNKGQSYTKATWMEAGRQTVTGLLLTSASTVTMADIMSGGQLHKALGKKCVDSYLKSKAAKSVIKIAQNPKFDPIDVAFKIIED